MERLIQRALFMGALMLAVWLLGGPDWAAIVAIMPAMLLADVVLPEDAERDLPMRERLPSARRAVLIVVVISTATAFGAAGLLDGFPGIAITFAVLGALVVAGNLVLRRWEQPRTA